MRAICRAFAPCLQRVSSMAAALHGELLPRAPQQLQVPSLQPASKLRRHVSNSMDDMLTECDPEQLDNLFLPTDVLPRYSDSEVCMGELSYETAERFRQEGFGTVCGKPALLKVVSLAEDPDAGSHVLKEVRMCYSGYCRLSAQPDANSTLTAQTCIPCQYFTASSIVCSTGPGLRSAKTHAGHQDPNL